MDAKTVSESLVHFYYPRKQQQVAAAIQRARNEALEEGAKKIEAVAERAAAEIRALIERPPVESPPTRWRY